MNGIFPDYVGPDQTAVHQSLYPDWVNPLEEVIEPFIPATPTGGGDTSRKEAPSVSYYDEEEIIMAVIAAFLEMDE